MKLYIRPETDIFKWDAHYKTHGLSLLSDRYRIERWNQVSQYCKPPILDIGGGISGLEKIFPNQVTVLDCSPEAIRHCTNGILGDALNPPFPDKSFETCCLIEILEHFCVTDTDIILQHAKRIAKSKVIITVPFATLGHPDMHPKTELDKKSNYFHHQIFYPFSFPGFLLRIFPKVTLIKSNYLMAVCHT